MNKYQRKSIIGNNLIVFNKSTYNKFKYCVYDGLENIIIIYIILGKVIKIDHV